MARNGRHWMKWLLLGAAAGLYWVGRQQQPKNRIPSITEIEEPEFVELYNRMSQLPHIQFLRRWLAQYAVRGRQNIRLLDVGCGPGWLDIVLARRPEVREVTGIDLADNMIHLARENTERLGVNNARFVLADAAELPFEDDSFDLVISTLSLHHWRQPVLALREIRRVLAPGGSMLIFDLRRDVPTIFLGAVTLASRYLVPEKIRPTGEPLGSFQAAYKPWEAVLLATKAGWTDPRASTGPCWMLLEADKGVG